MRKTLTTLVAITLTCFAWCQSTDFNKLEASFKENTLKAERQSVGKPLQVRTHVLVVQKRNGKPLIIAGTVYPDGTEVYSDIYIAPASMNTAMALKPGDQIQVSGVLKRREVKSKDVLRVSGYQSSVYGSNGSVYGGGGSTQGGTVTLTWPVYTIENSTIKVIETEAARLRALAIKQAAEEKVRNEIGANWKEAISRLDTSFAKKAIDLGLPKYEIDEAIREITRLDPTVKFYAQAIEFYKFLLKTGKANAGQALASSIDSSRPALFSVIVELGGINFKGKMDNGDTMLHYLIKERTYALRTDVASKNLKLFFGEADVEFIKIVTSHPDAAGLGDVTDQFGKSAKDYVKDAVRLVGSSSNEHYKMIRALILAME